MTVSFYSATKDGAGADVDTSVTASIVGGELSDFEGKSTTVEVDAPILTNGAARVGVTLEGGMTETGQPIGGMELGLGGGPSGGAVYETTTTLGPKITIGGKPSQPGAKIRRESRQRPRP